MKVLTSILALLLIAAAPAKKPAPPKEDTTPKPYENAEHKFRFKAPANWENAGAACHGSVFNFHVPINASSAQDESAYYGDIFTIAVNPLKNATDDTAAVIAQLQDEVKQTDPDAKFKTLPSIKIAGQEAAVVLVSYPKGKGKAGLARANRHAFVLKDGKAFGFIVFGHQSSVAQSAALAQSNVLKTFEWTEGEKPAAEK